MNKVLKYRDYEILTFLMEDGSQICRIGKPNDQPHKANDAFYPAQDLGWLWFRWVDEHLACSGMLSLDCFNTDEVKELLEFIDRETLGSDHQIDSQIVLVRTGLTLIESGEESLKYLDSQEMTNDFKLKFGDISHGWLTVEFEAKGRNIQFDASDVPIDSVEQFISACCEILEGRSQSRSTWFLEPTEYETTFQLEGNELVFTIEDSGPNGIKKNQPEQLLQFRATPKEIIKPIMEALRDLQTRYSPVEFSSDERWGRSFPDKVMAQLSKRFQNMI